MSRAEADQRSAARRAEDEKIAGEPQKPPLELPEEATALPVEAHLARQRRPIAVEGVVENGVVRPVDPSVKLTEGARVIVVASESD